MKYTPLLSYFLNAFFLWSRFAYYWYAKALICKSTAKMGWTWDISCIRSLNFRIDKQPPVLSTFSKKKKKTLKIIKANLIRCSYFFHFLFHVLSEDSINLHKFHFHSVKIILRRRWQILSRFFFLSCNFVSWKKNYFFPAPPFATMVHVILARSTLVLQAENWQRKMF